MFGHIHEWFVIVLIVADCENHFENHSLAHLVSRAEVNTALSESGPLTRSSKRRQSGGPDEDFDLSKKGKMVSADSVFPEPQTKATSRDQGTTGASTSAAETMSAVTASQAGFQRRCNPIQALLAKSVGNKVTLRSHPQVVVTDRTLQCPNETASAALATANSTAACHLTPQPAPASMQTHTSTPSTLQGPMQVIYKAPEGLSLVRNNTTPVKFSVQPAIRQKTGEKATQQVIILPTNLLIQKPLSTSAAVSTTKSATLLSNSSGFAVPETKIPVQQVSPLKSISTVTTSSAVSLSPQKSASFGISPGRKKTSELSSTRKGSITPSTTTDPSKCDLNQELKTVCIRDSQSILVTTRGGNTGVVKVQTSDNSVASVLPSSPIFTLPPKFQAFLVSKASTATTSTAQSTTTANFLPVVSSLNDGGISSNSASQSPSKSSNPVNPSPVKEGGTVPFNNAMPLPVGSVSDNGAKSAQILIGIDSLFPANSQTNASVPSPGWAAKNAASDNIIRLSQKRPRDTCTDPDPSTFQQVFVVASTTDVSASVSSITTTSAFLGSTVKFMSQSDSACSTVTVAKGLITPEPSIAVTTTALAVNNVKVRPNLGQAIGSTSAGTLTKVQGINVTGLAARILDGTTMTKKTVENTTKVVPVMGSSALATSSGTIFVQNINSAANGCLSLNANGPDKVTGSDGKGVTFSTYNTGHMASAGLLSAVQQKSVFHSVSTPVSVSDILNKRSELVVRSSAPHIACSVLGSPFNKNTSLPKNVMQNKPLDSTLLSPTSTSIKLPVVSSTTRVPRPLTLSTTKAKHVLDSFFTATQSVMASTARPHVNAVPGITTVQEKVVINTTAPLAPGTQLLINNTRFVVPAQGLATGSHVLLISSPISHPPGRVGTNSIYPAPRVTSTPAAASVVQGLRMVTPGKMSQDTSVGQLAPLTAKTEQSVSVNNLLTAVRPPPVSINSSTLAQVSQIGTPQLSGQQSLTHVVRLPSFLLPEVKECSAASSCILASCPTESVTVPAQSQIGLTNTTTPNNLQMEPGSAAPKLKPAVTAVKTVISWPSPVVTVSPMCSTVSRMQTLPVATVPPVGSSATTCVASVSPSVNTLLMSTCQSVRPVQPGNIQMTVTSHPPQIKNKTSTQGSGGQVICTPSKLLSPDGAILNILGCPSLQNLPVMTDKMTVGATTPNTPVLHTHDSDRMVTSDNGPEQP